VSIKYNVILSNQIDSSVRSEIEDPVWRPRPPNPSSDCDLVSAIKFFVLFSQHLV